MYAKASELVEVSHYLSHRGWSPATGGNFSVRVDNNHCLITQSGKDKLRLQESDLMVCTLDGKALDANLKPSAETALHTYLYRSNPKIGAVLHTHSVTSTVLSRSDNDVLKVYGFEMQKAICGNCTHDERIEIAIFNNNQNIEVLTAEVEKRALSQPGFVVRGHGLYAWGKDLDEARRHIEGFEFLLDCLWQEKLLGRR